MLTYLPIALACFGVQPCLPDMNLHNGIARLSVVALVSHPEPPRRQTFGASPSLRLASERASILSVSALSRAPRAQMPLLKGSGRNSSKGMLICAGVVAGLYAGAAIGAAMDDRPDKTLGLIGAPIGGVVGGLFVWKLVK